MPISYLQLLLSLMPNKSDCLGSPRKQAGAYSRFWMGYYCRKVSTFVLSALPQEVR
jgi:hypothetical protein